MLAAKDKNNRFFFLTKDKCHRITPEKGRISLTPWNRKEQHQGQCKEKAPGKDAQTQLIEGLWRGKELGFKFWKEKYWSQLLFKTEK